ncbi:MAG: hypothetical protein M9962_11545 [Oligoflexia bacterium]|nr:hypothetical protein [Oligoflexia bacterium]
MAVGQEIICYCSSCDLDLRHVIVAHKSGNTGPIAKVRCNTCAKIHAYRNKPAAGGTGVRVVKERQKATVIPIEVEWMEQLNANKDKQSLPYVPTKDFKVGDVIEHPQFGCGVVKNLKDGNKFEVIFQKDVKVLVHRLKAD